MPRGRGCGTIYATPLLSAVRAASRAWEILTGAGNGVCATVTGGDDRALLRQLNDDITSSGVVTPDCAILPCVRNPKVLPYVSVQDQSAKYRVVTLRTVDSCRLLVVHGRRHTGA